MRRRALLVSVPLVVSGCTAVDDTGGPSPETVTTTAVAVDCEAVERPPVAADDADEVEPRPYPGAPDDVPLIEWVIEHERAYVTNRLLAEHTVTAITGIGVEERTTEQRPAGTVVRFQYSYGFETDDYIADSPLVTAAYYVTEQGALRATNSGGEFAADLDPTVEGNPVVCF